MPAQVPSYFDFTNWTTLVIPGVGILVAAAVAVLVIFLGRLRRKRLSAKGSKEEDLSWEDLLEMVRRRRKLKQAGQEPEEESEDGSLEALLAGPVPRALRASAGAQEDQPFLTAGAAERRGGRRRWGNPTEIYVDSQLWPDRLHALVVNRSTGGLALLLDTEVPAGTTIKVRSVEAPGSVPSVEMDVRYCRKAGKNFLIGCEFSDEIPWNVRVWFG